MIKDNENYNKKLKPNSEFIMSLKEKIPEFFNNYGFDLEKFKNSLNDQNVNEFNEGYKLDFIGKNYARRQSGELPNTVVSPDKIQNNNNSDNLFFTGDNIEVLKHLQYYYSNKIDVIYIDPPYNTGNKDFIYPDSFEYSDEKIKEIFGINDDEIDRLKSIRGSSSHSAWLTFMYPRLSMAKRLLSENGTMFISIDDNEYANLSLLISELFGENNYDTLVRNVEAEHSSGTLKRTKRFRNIHDYVISVYKNKDKVEFNKIHEASNDREIVKIDLLDKSGKNYFSIKDNLGNIRKLYWKFDEKIIKSLDIKGLIYWVNNKPCLFVSKRKKEQTANLSVNSKNEDKNSDNYFTITAPNGLKYTYQWKFSKEKINNLINKGLIYWGQSGTSKPRLILPNDERRTVYLKSILNYAGNTIGRKEVENYFKGKNLFSYPKPVKFIYKLIESASKKDSIILDFFAGSGTTAEAVMKLNADDGGNRKFIMAQLPEKTYKINKGIEQPTEGGKVAYDSGYMSIDEVSRDRIRLSSKSIKEEKGLFLPNDFDGSFKHFRVVKPNVKTLDELEEFNPNEISLFTDMVDNFSSDSLNISGSATGEETILTTWLLSDGYSLNTNVDSIRFNNYLGYCIENDRLYLISEGWDSNDTKELLNSLGKYIINIQTVVIFGYSFKMSDIRELEIGLNQLDRNVQLLKRY